VDDELALTEVAGGVLAWLPPDARTGVANAGVIVDDDGVTVVDTLMVRSQWAPFAAAVAELGPVRRVVLTHPHVEHVGGTKAFPAAAVYGTRFTSEMLDLPMPTDAYQRFMPEFADEFEDLAEVGTRAATHVIAGAASLTPRVEVLPAPGHTPGDAIVLVADADVCFAGGLCSFGVTPQLWQADPSAWVDVLDVVVDLADVIVPGFGPVGGEPEVRDLQGYLRACIDAARTHTKVAPGPWDRWRERDLDAINVERAVLLAEGRDEMPPTMARTIDGDD
jgi:glyoxylase-like metal-dependent hydrolase (beta-lactamase superfamily II)